jgi:UDP:flavonoid glycosyltransferase YjiC (YdhE family)
VASLSVDVVVTLGAHNDPADLGPQPDTVHLEQWLPLPTLLARCSLVVCHGGSGTLLASLAAGLPLVLVPRGSDQFDNAAACVQAGAARVVPPEALNSDVIATEVQRLLDDRSYREAAGCLRAEIEAMPEPAAVVPRLEQLAGPKRPASTIARTNLARTI